MLTRENMEIYQLSTRILNQSSELLGNARKCETELVEDFEWGVLAILAHTVEANRKKVKEEVQEAYGVCWDAAVVCKDILEEVEQKELASPVKLSITRQDLERVLEKLQPLTDRVRRGQTLSCSTSIGDTDHRPCTEFR